MRNFFFPALAITFLFCSTNSFAQRQLIEKIAAVVDDEIIMSGEVQQYAYFEAANQHINPETDIEAYAKIEKKVLDALINQKILLAQAKLDSITIDDGQVEQSLDQQIQDRVRQAGGEAELEKYLGKSIREIRKLYKTTVRKQMLAQKIQSSKFQDMKVSRAEIENFFNTHEDSLPEVGASANISQILIEVKPGDDAFAEARKTAVIVLDSIRKGADFGKLAQRFSSDPGSAKKGGDLGWFNRNDFVKEFAEAAVKLEPGEVSDVVKSEFGYHIIQLIEKTGEKIHVRHILIGVASTADDKTAAKQKIQKIREDIMNAKISFEDAALQYSDDPAKRGNLGNLGWVELSTIQDKTFLKAVQALEAGKISDPFESNVVTGYHIVQLNGKRDTRKVNLRDDWQAIENFALRQKQSKEMDKWLDQIRSKFYIDIRM